MQIPYQTKEKLVKQAQTEKDDSYQYKRPRITEWKYNEDQLNGRKTVTKNSRANQSFGLAHKMVNTFLSKIDEPLDFDYERGELGDSRKVEFMNAVKDKYRKLGRWDYLDRLGKYVGVSYGVSIYLAYGENNDGEFNFINRIIDPEDFFVDTSIRVDDIEGSCRHMGWWGLKYSKKQLTELLKNPNYDKKAIKDLLAGEGENNNTKQDVDKRNRQYSLGVWKNNSNEKGVYEFYTYITTGDDGERYYLVFTDDGHCIRAQKWTDIQKSGLYPVWYWQPYPEPFEFWSRSPLEVSRLTIEAQETSLNQLLDNAESINRPQKAVNVDRIRNINQVKYKKDGILEVTGTGNMNEAIQVLNQTPIETPVETYKMLDTIVQSVTGVTSEVQGVSSQDKVGVYQGNLAQANDRFALMQNSYEQGYYRLALLFREAVKQHMSEPMAVKITGPRGMEFVKVAPADLKLSNGDFDIMIRATTVEQQSNLLKNKQKIDFLNGWIPMPKVPDAQALVNLRVAFEEGAKVAGWDDEEIKRLLDKENFADNEQADMAESNIQDIITGKDPYIFYNADMGYLFSFRSTIMAVQDTLEKKPDIAKKLDEFLTAMTAIVTQNEITKQDQNQELMQGLQQNAQSNAQNQQANQPEQPDQLDQAGKVQDLNQSAQLHQQDLHKGALEIAQQQKELQQPNPPTSNT